MKIVFIGAGNLATHVSQALHKAGHEVVQVYSRTYESASCLATLLGAQPVTDLSLLRRDAHLYIMSVKDDALPILANQLPQLAPEAVVVHTAGSVPMGVLEGTASHYGVLYPMQSFSKARKLSMKHVPFYVEASDQQTIDMLLTVAHSMSDTARVLSSANRRYLHLAAVFASNFTNYCYTVADTVMAQCQLPFTDLLPLIDETAAKVHDLSPRDAQTGPAVRYDESVMCRHLELLNQLPEAKALYELASAGIHHEHSKK